MTRFFIGVGAFILSIAVAVAAAVVGDLAGMPVWTSFLLVVLVVPFFRLWPLYDAAHRWCSIDLGQPRWAIGLAALIHALFVAWFILERVEEPVSALNFLAGLVLGGAALRIARITVTIIDGPRPV